METLILNYLKGGRSSTLRDLYEYLAQVHNSPRSKSEKVAVATCKNLFVHFAGELKNTDSSVTMRSCWFCMAVLIRRIHNANAEDFLEDFQSSEECNTILSLAAAKYISRYVDNTDLDEYWPSEFCLLFLSRFTMGDTNRQLVAGRIDGLIPAVLAAMGYMQGETSSLRASAGPGDEVGFTVFGRIVSIRISALHTVCNMLGRSVYSDPNNVEVFLSSGGIVMLKGVVVETLENALQNKAAGIDEAELNLIIGAITCLASFCAGVSYIVATKGMREGVQMDVADVRTITSLLYDCFKVVDALSYLDKCVTSYINFFEYLRLVYPGTATCEDALMHNSPSQSNSPFIALIVHLKRHGDLAHQQENVMKVLGLWGSQMVRVDEAIDAELDRCEGATVTYHSLEYFSSVLIFYTLAVGATARTTDPSTVCAYPHCGNNSITYGARLKACSRCKQVHYCGM